MRRTKIVATLGPKSDSPEMIEKLILAGVNVFRLNFSHGTHAEHAERVKHIRDISHRLDCAVGILQDLQGPKIRTGNFPDGIDSVTLVEGQQFVITTDEQVLGDAQRVCTVYDALPTDVRPGDRILLSDGLLELKVLSTTHQEVITTVVTGGELRARQGINLPGVKVSAPSLTDKDKEDLLFGLSLEVDFVAISFVRKPQDILDVKSIIAAADKDTPVIAKLEKPEAIDHLEDILDVVDGVMVARGDLGVEMPLEQVPPIQKRIIREANQRAIPVITATQMLESMIENPRPTRAEASDVANAIFDGTDAVMLSGETARGNYPVEAVKIMARIAETAEAEVIHLPTPPFTSIRSDRDANLKAIGAAISALVDTMPIDAIWVFTEGGKTASLVAHFRPDAPIIAFTTSKRLYHRLTLTWGMTPIWIEEYENDSIVRQVHPLLEARGLLRAGDRVIVTGGHPFGSGLLTNFVKIIHTDPNHPSAVL